MDASEIRESFAGAVAHQAAGRLAEAEALYRAVVEADPRHTGALLRLGGLALEGGRPELAVATLERATALEGENAALQAALGQAYLRLGQAAKALASFEAAAAAEPGFAPAHFLAGLALSELGRRAEARRAYARAIEFDPGFVPALFNLAASLEQDGDRKGAIERYREALARAPDFAAAHLNLGIALAAEGDFAAAIAPLERAAALEPGLLQAHAALGNALLELGEPQRALEAYTRGLELAPRSALLHYNRGKALRRLERLEAALMAYREALAADSGLVEAMINAGSICQELGRYVEAERYCRQAIAADGKAALAYTGLALAHHAQGELDTADAAALRAIELAPERPDGHGARGLVLQERGRLSEAAAAFRRALALDPHFVPALVHLVNMREIAPSEDEARRVRALLATRPLSAAERVSLHFALGRLADEGGDYDAAFAEYQAGNAIRAKGVGYDHAATVRHVEALMRVFDRDLLSRAEALGASSERPIFVLGMPRSGTTLIEQILASHPQVHGSGELTASAVLLDGIAALPAARQAHKAYPEAVPLLDAAAAQALAARYLDVIGRDAGDAARITDKLPFNFQRIGLISLLLPRAHIIHCQRDAYDTCLSCYFQDFQERHPFVYELERLGRYYREYERLMAHWRSVLPRPMLEVPYEALVADPEPWCRRILAHCGLAWDERALSFFATERTVRTASYWQVRQPIYASSVGRWKHYRRHLGPLFATLGRTPPEDDAA